VVIKSATQLLQRCDKVGIYTVAETTMPNRRSRAVPPPVRQVARKNVLKAVGREPSAPSSLLDATAVVVRTSTTALSTREIIALIIERKLWKPTGATPWQTLSAALNRDIAANGTQSRFKKKTRGKYALRQSRDLHRRRDNYAESSLTCRTATGKIDDEKINEGGWPGTTRTFVAP
jgi:hypothetical protein